MRVWVADQRSDSRPLSDRYEFQVWKKKIELAKLTLEKALKLYKASETASTVSTWKLWASR